MKKIILTALLSFGMLFTFANDSTETTQKEKEKKTPQDQYCGEVTLSCGVTGQICGQTLFDFWRLYAEAENFHCIYMHDENDRE